jgi:hypothetical protein
MYGITYKFSKEQRTPPNFFGEINFDDLEQVDIIKAEEILQNPNITLYRLDFENANAIFVETPIEVNLSLAPFYNLFQYQKALRIIQISFDTMIHLAENISVDDERLVLIYSVGRCGSTLASQVFAQVPGVINLSEPIALTNIVVARNSKKYQDKDLVELLRATIRILCKSDAQTAWAIKGRSFDIAIADWLNKLYPQSTNFFLYRHAEKWFESSLRAFDRGEENTEEERKLANKNRREFMNKLVPEIKGYNANPPLEHADILAMMWLSIMTCYVKWTNMGIKMSAIRYTSWRANPRKTAEAMLDICHCRPNDLSEIYEALRRDSQAGTRLARENLKQNSRLVTESELESFNKQLKNHDFINQADFEAPNTIRI